MVITLDQYCRIRYGLGSGETPTKAQRNTVSKMCRDKVVPAFKSGRRWFINDERFTDVR